MFLRGFGETCDWMKLFKVNAMKKILVILCFVSMAVPVFAGNSFAPWQRSVTVGDETIVKKTYSKKHRHDNHRSVYGGFQGGAWLLIRFFQRTISPLDGPNCRFAPVCSAYGRGAVERYGALLGSILAGERLLRCNPYNKGGYDPVPESLTGK